MTGSEVLAELPLWIATRDRRAGARTAGFISGYQGSPLAGLDRALASKAADLSAADIVFQPGLNEDLAATAVWGSQQANLFGKGRFDGVFGLWYGKGPGVDRAGDALKHANYAGVMPLGGVVALVGDDHLAKSSSIAFQSEQALAAAGIPVLYPASLPELLEFGIRALEMSRFSGAWVAMKCVTEVVDTTATVRLTEPYATTTATATTTETGLHIRWPDDPRSQERRMFEVRLPAARRFAEANSLDRVTHGTPSARRLGIIAAGRAWAELSDLLAARGLTDRDLSEAGVSILKPGLIWPVTDAVSAWAARFEEVLVLEDKRGFLEAQLKEALYSRPEPRPRVWGKRGDRGHLLPEVGQLSAEDIAGVLRERLEALGSPLVRALKPRIDATPPTAAATRPPWYCAGCPHNISTRVPEGSRAGAGIGCHSMALWMDRATSLPTHMGGEGVNWLGQAPFTNEQHIFQNIGDGTFQHSGSLAVRAAVAAGATMTFKVLYNDAVAMTGGQKVEGATTPWGVAGQLLAEGVKRVVVVSQELESYAGRASWPAGVDVVTRDRFDAIQAELAATPGVTALIYDQTCAAEKRRRRRKGEYPRSLRRVVIHEGVCEGCGDCGVQSNCVAIQPIETDLGLKRRIDQSECNQDLSCLEGLCPSLVTVEVDKAWADGRRPVVKEPADGRPNLSSPAETATAPLPFKIIVAGIGGTGVVSIGRTLARAAQADGLEATLLEETGLAQKNGAVVVHICLYQPGLGPASARTSAGKADLVLATDMVAATSESVEQSIGAQTRVVANIDVRPLGRFTIDPDSTPNPSELVARLGARCGDRVRCVSPSKILGKNVSASRANLALLGAAALDGLPIPAERISEALGGAHRAADVQAFHDGLNAVMTEPLSSRAPEALDCLITRRSEILMAYQSPSYAKEYSDVLSGIFARIAHLDETERLRRAIADGLFKLMAYKDEYEVARQLSDPAFRRRIRHEFGPGARIAFHFAPPSLRPGGAAPRRKIRVPQWAIGGLGVLAALRWLRATPIDPFGRHADRRLERALADRYKRSISTLSLNLSPDRLAAAYELASLPQKIRGFGSVKADAVARIDCRWAELDRCFDI